MFLANITRAFYYFEQIVSLNDEVRRALYGSSLSTLDLDSYLPDLIGHSEVMNDEHRKQLAKHLPARIEGCSFYLLIFFLGGLHSRLFLYFDIGYPWTLVFSTAQHGFSLNSLYRKMAGVDSPVLLIIEDTRGNVML